MPDDDGKLTEADKQAVLEWLKAHDAESPRCPACGQVSWILGSHLVTSEIHVGVGVSSDLTYPSFFLICENCSNTLFFNAVTSGIIEGTEEDGKEPRADGDNKEGGDG